MLHREGEVALTSFRLTLCLLSRDGSKGASLHGNSGVSLGGLSLPSLGHVAMAAGTGSSLVGLTWVICSLVVPGSGVGSVGSQVEEVDPRGEIGDHDRNSGEWLLG